MTSANAIHSAPAPTRDPADPNIERWDDIGLVLIHDFISAADEAAMIAAFHAADPRTGGRKRLSQHFGYHFDYTTFGASDTRFTPLPPYVANLLPRLPVQGYLPDQFTVQYYPPGAGIPPHVDTHSMFSEALYSLSFGSAVPMAFKKSGTNDARKMRLPKRSLLASPDPPEPQPPSAGEASGPSGQSAPAHPPPAPPATQQPAGGTEQQESEGEELPSWELLLPARSLLLMTGASRYGYTHGIKGRKTDVVGGQTVPREGRYSITMRTTRRGLDIGCTCSFPGVCDARVREEQAAVARDADPVGLQ